MTKFQKTKVVFIALIFCGIFGLAESSQAEHFFQQNNTWYEQIPANPVISANSANYVADIVGQNPDIFVNSGDEFSVPVYHAAIDTAVVTVPVYGYAHVYQEANHWNDVPIPTGALPAGNTAACAGQYRDGHMTVISYDNHYAWDFFGARYCNGIWSAESIRKWDLTGDGINSPYDDHGTVRWASVPLLHGLIMKSEIDAGAIDHAMNFIYGNGSFAYHTQLYPSVREVGDGSHPEQSIWALKGGERIQLDPTFNCNTITVPEHRTICVAMQQYGMIMVDNSEPGYTYVMAEQKDPIQDSWSWLSGFFAYTGIPMNQLRIVDPVYPGGCQGSPCAGDTTSPAAPQGLSVQ